MRLGRRHHGQTPTRWQAHIAGQEVDYVRVTSSGHRIESVVNVQHEYRDMNVRGSTARTTVWPYCIRYSMCVWRKIGALLTPLLCIDGHAILRE